MLTLGVVVLAVQDFNRTLLFDIKLLSVRKAK
jgi:hypothetical protein